MRLANDQLAIDLDPRTGSIRQITDRRTGRHYLDDTRGARLAKLIVPTPDHISRPLFSHEAGRPTLGRHGDAVTIEFPELRYRGQATGVFLTVRVRLPEDSAEAFFSAEIRNQSPHRVHEIWFPWLGGRRGVPGRSDGSITTGHTVEADIYGRLYEAGRSPHAFSHHQHRIASACMLPMMDYGVDGGGLSYNKYEQRPSPHVLVFENPNTCRDDLCLTWAWATHVFAEPGETWRSCEFGVGVHQGDWHETADRFRAWLTTWRKPCDTPAAAKEKIGLLHLLAHSFSGERCNEFTDLPEIARDALGYGVSDLLVWDYAASVYYRPDRGGFWEMPDERRQEIRSALAEVRALGCSVSTYVNWCLIAERNSTWEELRPLVQESMFGALQFGYPGGSLDGALYTDPSYEMCTHSVCCGADGYQAYANRVLEQTFALGFDSIAVDMAAEWKPCFSKRHGHASPWEAWAKTYEWYGDVTQEVRRRNPGSYTVAELPDLYNTQHLDFWWTWGWRYPNLIRPEVFRYVLPDVTPAWCIDENQRDVVAEAFMYGSLFAVATRDMMGRLSDAPDLAAQIGRLGRLRRQTAAYVCQGRFMDNRGLTVVGGRGAVYVSDPGLGVVLANGSSRSRTVRVALDLAAFTGFVVDECGLHLEGADAVRIEPKQRGSVLSFRVGVRARQAAILTIQRAPNENAELGAKG